MATKVQWRVGWSSSTNASFRGYSDWFDAMEGETEGEVLRSVEESARPVGTRMSTTEEVFWESAGVEFWPEVRTVDA